MNHDKSQQHREQEREREREQHQHYYLNVGVPGMFICFSLDQFDQFVLSLIHTLIYLIHVWS